MPTECSSVESESDGFVRPSSHFPELKVGGYRFEEEIPVLGKGSEY